MNMDYYLAMATSIKERSQLLNISAEESQQLTWLKKWRQRKTLVSDAEFQQSLAAQGLTPAQFDCGVQPLQLEDLPKLFSAIEPTDWYQLHQQLFATELPLTDDLDSAIRFHLDYCQQQMLKLLAKKKNMQFTIQAQQEWLNNLSADLMQLAKKTLIWDVHDIIERTAIQAEDEAAEFQLYLAQRFGKACDCQGFYQEYPVLQKLLVTRLHYALSNLSLFLEALEAAQPKLQAKWHLQFPLTINHFITGQGDSHSGGKTVVQIEINQVPLIFKYKNLQIGEGFNHFLQFVETLAPKSSFYKVARVCGPDYTFEEKVEQKSCASQQELQQFYRHYGELLAVVYWLGSSDLHMENLIARGCDPVLIDVETILAVRLPAKPGEVFSKAYLKNLDSIMTAGLLPTQKKWGHTVELSALGGKRQKLARKVNKSTAEKSSAIHIEKAEAYIEMAQNLPLLNGVPVDYHAYSQELLAGFQELNQILCQNRKKVQTAIENCFTNQELRVLLRDTENYGHLLDFATHPSCMSNYPEREKITENLWHTRYVLPAAIPYEVADLLNHDVPLFTVKTDQTNLLWENETIENYFSQSPLQSVLQHIESLDTFAFQVAELEMKESLGLLSYTLNPVLLPKHTILPDTPLLAKAADIGDLIYQQLTFDKAQTKVFFLNSELDENGSPILTYPEQELYQGSSGLYLFYLYLQHYVPKDTYAQLLGWLEQEIFLVDKAQLTLQGVFDGVGARLLLAFYAYQLTGADRFYAKLEHFLQQVKNCLLQQPTATTNEWIYGQSSLLALLVQIWHQTNHEISKECLVLLLQNWSTHPLSTSEFAHGDAGVLYAFRQVDDALPELLSPALQNYLNELTERLAGEAAKIAAQRFSWCRGAAGLSSVYAPAAMDAQAYLTNLVREVKPIDSCLCHGFYGLLDAVLTMAEPPSAISISELRKLALAQNYYLASVPNMIPVGLFTGLSGIGYQLLRLHDPAKVPSILFFMTTKSQQSTKNRPNPSKP